MLEVWHQNWTLNHLAVFLLLLEEVETLHAGTPLASLGRASFPGRTLAPLGMGSYEEKSLVGWACLQPSNWPGPPTCSPGHASVASLSEESGVSPHRGPALSQARLHPSFLHLWK
jgi:hypothetical protein